MGSASPDVRLRVRGIAVTVSVRFCGGGFDSFLGFEYGVVITLASRVFEYFFRFFLRACVICAFFGFVGVTWCDTPTFLAYPHVFLTCGPFIGFSASLAFIRATVALASISTMITAPILLLVLRSAALLAFFSEFRGFRSSFGSS